MTLHCCKRYFIWMSSETEMRESLLHAVQVEQEREQLARSQAARSRAEAARAEAAVLKWQTLLRLHKERATEAEKVVERSSFQIHYVPSVL